MNNIKALLTERGRSIYWLAHEVGMSYQAIHKLANAPAIPPGTTWQTLQRVAAALGVSVDELTKGE
jgi:DNA-binding Xre family transcriptional regulator